MSRLRQRPGLAETSRERMELVFRQLPQWTALPAAFIGFTIVYFLWPTKTPVSPPLGLIACLFGVALILATLVVGYATGELRPKAVPPPRVNFRANLYWLAGFSPENFAQMLAAYFAQNGYAVGESDGPDGHSAGGPDMVLYRDGIKTIVQHRYWRRLKVGTEEVHELYGLQMKLRAKRAILITTGTITAEARRFAEKNALELIDGAHCAELSGEFRQAFALSETEHAPA
jgi:HJR/Mrr/RecB family endonuclease